MILSSRTITSVANRALAREQILFVHSVFEKTVNLKAGDQLISLHRHQEELSPFGLVVEEIRDFRTHFFAGARFEKTEGGWVGGELHLTFEREPTIMSMHPPCVENDRLKRAYRVVDRALRTIGDRSPLIGLVRESIAEEQLAGEIRVALGELRATMAPRQWNLLYALAGRGIGLTPSSDDFIVGMTFANRLIGRAPLVAITDVPHTTDISRAYLSAAIEGAFSAAFLSIAEAIASGDEQRIMRSALVLASKGHSSGTDSLIGLLIGLRLSLYDSKTKGGIYGNQKLC